MDVLSFRFSMEAAGDGDQAYPFSPEQRLWIALMKEKGVATSKIKAEFSMSACDFWLWGYLKEKVYRPTSMVQLKARIKEEMYLIPSEMVKAAVLSTKMRAMKLVECQGEVFEGRRIRQGLRM